MTRRFALVLLYMITAAAVVFAAATTDALMAELDSAISRREEYSAEREIRIDSLRHLASDTSDRRRLVGVLSELFNTYHPFSADSAYSISLRLEALGRELGDRDIVTGARLTRANVLTTTGMYAETLGILDSIDAAVIPDYLRPYYYHTRRTVYGLMADYVSFDDSRREYMRLTDLYRDSLLQVNPEGSLVHSLILADRLNCYGRPAEGLAVMQRYMDTHPMSDHDIAVSAWTLSESYGLLGDKENQKRQLIISSIGDMKAAVREYISLRELALMLYAEGDLERAYHYLTIAVDDATLCNARQRMVELSYVYPTINSIYVDKVRSQHRNLARTVVIITVLLGLLLALVLYLRKQMQRIAQARGEVEEANRNLSLLNSRILASNSELEDANNNIAEISELKEVYIGRYMDQCLGYIDKLDSLRKTIAKLAGSGRADEILRMTKSADMVDRELKAFYDQFDRTFLSIFPSFVEDLNALLQAGEELRPKKPGGLSPELRIYALIRLGIPDSDKIATFLRYSVTTIYNYRTRVRNKARGDRNLLESEVLKIGRTRAHAEAPNSSETS